MSTAWAVIWRLAVVGAVFACMEGVAWFTHKYVMHGLLWVLHADHHHPKHRGLQKNDWFAVFFAAISFILIVAGTLNSFSLSFWVGIGIMAYGMAYFLFHEVIFHRRIRINYRPTTGYVGRLIRAHAAHHRLSHAHDGVSFSFLYPDPRYGAA